MTINQLYVYQSYHSPSPCSPDNHQLGLGVVSAGGYYYLSKTDPSKIAAAERAVQAKTGVDISNIGHTTNSALDPNKFVNFKLKEIQVGWLYLSMHSKVDAFKGLV